jgi:acetylglutamate kinase
MDVVEMVLVGRVNKHIVNGINTVGGRAVGLCGSDGSLVRARTYGEGAHGLVGEVQAVDPAVLLPLLDAGYIPVISSVAADRGPGPQHQRRHGGRRAGGGPAGREADPAHRHRLESCATGTDPGSLIRQVSLAGARQLIAAGVVNGGMTPKTECCIRALAQGVGRPTSWMAGCPTPCCWRCSPMPASARWWWAATGCCSS